MKILLIRGGALGDFILTLPALGMVRKYWPEAHIELLGYRSTAQLAVGRHYVNAFRSQDEGGLARFFARGSELDGDLAKWLEDFELVISCFYDPDKIFLGNLERCGLRAWEVGDGLPPYRGQGRVLSIDPRVNTSPAARHFCAPLERLGMPAPETYASQIHLLAEDRLQAENILRQYGEGPFVLCHPGSGGAHKNWPLERWVEWDPKDSRFDWSPAAAGLWPCGTRAHSRHASFTKTADLGKPVLADFGGCGGKSRTLCRA